VQQPIHPHYVTAIVVNALSGVQTEMVIQSVARYYV